MVRPLKRSCRVLPENDLTKGRNTLETKLTILNLTTYMQAGGLVYCDVVHQNSALDATSWSVPLSHVNNSNTLKRLSEITLASNNTRLPKEHCFCNVPRLRPFVLLVRVLRWSTDGITLIAENLSTGRETCPSATLPTDLTWTEPGTDDEPHEPWHGLLKG